MTACRLSHAFCVGLALASVVPGWTAAPLVAQEAAQLPTFQLCKDNVAEVSARQVDERFLVTVRLTDAGTEHWAAFTTEYLARQVRVKVGTVPLVEAQVRTPISSGLVEIARPDSESAEALREAIEAAPESPCGADGSG